MIAVPVERCDRRVTPNPANSAPTHLVTGGTMTLVTVPPDLRPGDRWRLATTPGIHLYVLIGTSNGHPAVYVGITQALTGARPGASFRTWVVQTGRLRANKVALIRLTRPPQRAELELLEKRVIRQASTAILVLNTITGAPRASRELGSRAQSVAAWGDSLWADVHRLAMGGARGPLTIPATTQSEQAVRAVLHAGRPLGQHELLALVNRTGATPWASVRRDLHVLETRTAGTPRVRLVHHEGRAYAYPTAHLTEVDALDLIQAAALERPPA